MRHMMRSSATVVAVGFLIVASACGGDDEQSSTSTIPAATAARAAETATGAMPTVAAAASATRTATVPRTVASPTVDATPTLPPFDDSAIMLEGTFRAFVAALEAKDPAQIQMFLSTSVQPSMSDDDINALLACLEPGSAIDIAQTTFEVGDAAQQPRIGVVSATLSMQPADGSAEMMAEITWPFIDEGQPHMHQWKVETLPACPFPTE